MDDSVDLQVFLPLLGMTATMVGALVYLIRTSRTIEATNNAVNNVPEGHPTIYAEVQHIKAAVDQLLEANQDFSDKGWRTLPADIGTASGLTETIRALQHDQEQTNKKLDLLITEVRDHVQWELSQKYQG